MDPQLKSILTSIALGLSTSAAAWAANKGLIPSADQSVIANDLVTFGFSAVAAGLVWYKTRSHTPDAQIAAVNDADNGCKVVPNGSPTPAVTASLK